MRKEKLLEELVPFGQDHLLAFWDDLDEVQRGRLAAEIEAVDFAQIQQLTREGAAHEDWVSLASQAVAPPAVRLDDRDGKSLSNQNRQDARAEGQRLLVAGKVGVLLVAGGQGSRLGFEHPKGMYPIGPVSGASLIQIHLEKVVATAKRYAARVPLYIMTSPLTHNETVAFLDQNEHFGVSPDDLVVFCQGVMPAVDAQTGRLLLADRDRLFLSPDGHGGMVSALGECGAIEHMRGAGVEQLYYFQVDNPLTPVCDPEFLGHHALAKSEFTTLVVAKQEPGEKLGVVVEIEGVVQIIEYINLPDEAASRRAGDGSLKLWAGSVAVHAIDVEFLRRMTSENRGLPFHASLKKAPHISPTGESIDPSEPNALKFEQFIFDLLPFAERAIVVEGAPSDCFAPLQNGSGAETDTPETTRAALVAQHRGWLEAAGATVAPEEDVEISPLWALDAKQVAERVEKGRIIEKATYLR